MGEQLLLGCLVSLLFLLQAVGQLLNLPLQRVHGIQVALILRLFDLLTFHRKSVFSRKFVFVKLCLALFEVVNIDTSLLLGFFALFLELLQILSLHLQLIFQFLDTLA